MSVPSIRFSIPHTPFLAAILKTPKSHPSAPFPIFRRFLGKIGRYFLPLLLISFLLVLTVSACNSRTPTPPPPPSASPTSTDDGILRLLYWQAPTILNPHLASGLKDYDGARLVYEPLASYDKDGKLIPFLASEIPTLENGGIAKDGKSVIWKLKKDIKWSDGERFTARDVAFTYKYITDPEVAATTQENYANILTIDVLDEHTIRIKFKEATPSWSIPFVGSMGLILPEHIFKPYQGEKAREAPANLQPVGTGPYKVLNFKPGDIIVLEPNELFREDPKELFERVELKGGGDAASAARAVLQTGEVDFAYNLQVEAPILNELASMGKGRILASFGPQVERIMLNFTDPNKTTDRGEKSSVKFPHPFLTEFPVREALDFAIDRATISQQLYGVQGNATAQLLMSPKSIRTDKIASEYSLEKAAAILDKAGWKDTNSNGTRDKNGVELKVLFQTSTNSVRQKTQEIIKQSLEKIGIGVELKSIDASIFFSGDPSNPETVNRFYADLEMFSNSNENPDPGAYLKVWTCDEAAQKSNNWQKSNYSRYCNPEYDKLWQKSERELDPKKRNALFKQMDELLSKDVAVIPMINRAIANGVSNRLTGLELTPWDANTWDIKNWRRRD